MCLSLALGRRAAPEPSATMPKGSPGSLGERGTRSHEPPGGRDGRGEGFGRGKGGAGLRWETDG